MMYFLALLPATMLTEGGYATCYLAHRSEGTLKSFGKYLGFWTFTLAALMALGALLAAARGQSLHGMIMDCHPGDNALRPCAYTDSWRHPAPGSGAQVAPGAPRLPPPASPAATPLH